MSDHNYIENVLYTEENGEYLFFLMDEEKYLEYDDPDVYE